MHVWVYALRYGIFGGEGNVFVHKLVGPGCLKWKSQVTCVRLRAKSLEVRINEKSLSSLSLAYGAK